VASKPLLIATEESVDSLYSTCHKCSDFDHEPQAPILKKPIKKKQRSSKNSSKPASMKTEGILEKRLKTFCSYLNKIPLAHSKHIHDLLLQIKGKIDSLVLSDFSTKNNLSPYSTTETFFSVADSSPNDVVVYENSSSTFSQHFDNKTYNQQYLIQDNQEWGIRGHLDLSETANSYPNSTENYSRVEDLKAWAFIHNQPSRDEEDRHYKAVLHDLLRDYKRENQMMMTIEPATQKKYVPQTMTLFGNAVKEGYFSELKILPLKTQSKIDNWVDSKILGKSERKNKWGEACKNLKITKIVQIKELFSDKNDVAAQILSDCFKKFFRDPRMIWLNALMNLSNAKNEGKVWYILNKHSIEKVCLEEERGIFDYLLIPLRLSDSDKVAFLNKKEAYFGKKIKFIENILKDFNLLSSIL